MRWKGGWSLHSSLLVKLGSLHSKGQLLWAFSNPNLNVCQHGNSRVFLGDLFQSSPTHTGKVWCVTNETLPCCMPWVLILSTARLLGTPWIYSSSLLPGELLSLTGVTHHSHISSHSFRALFSSVSTSSKLTAQPGCKLSVILYFQSQKEGFFSLFASELPISTHYLNHTTVSHLFLAISIQPWHSSLHVNFPSSWLCGVICEKSSLSSTNYQSTQEFPE